MNPCKRIPTEGTPEHDYLISGTNLNSIFAFKASAILLRKDKLGVLDTFSNLAMVVAALRTNLTQPD